MSVRGRKGLGSLPETPRKSSRGPAGCLEFKSHLAHQRDSRKTVSFFVSTSWPKPRHKPFMNENSIFYTSLPCSDRCIYLQVFPSILPVHRRFGRFQEKFGIFLSRTSLAKYAKVFSKSITTIPLLIFRGTGFFHANHANTL